MASNYATPKLISLNPHIEVRGQLLRVLLPELDSTVYQALRQQHGLLNIEAGLWYSIEDILHFFRHLDGIPGEAFSLETLGEIAFAQAEMPPQFRSLADGLDWLNFLGIAHLRYTDRSDKPWFEAISFHDRLMRIIDASPLPHPFVQGLISGLIQRLSDRPEAVGIHRYWLSPNEHNADGAVYDILW